MTKRTNGAAYREQSENPCGEATKYASDVLAELYHALLKLPSIELPDGTTAHVEAYYPPRADDEGEYHCGVDVRLPNGDLLEFTMTNTGWERSLTNNQMESLLDAYSRSGWPSSRTSRSWRS